MSTLVAEPHAHSAQLAARAIPELKLKTIELNPPDPPVKQETEPHPLTIVFIACVIAFHLAAAMVGTLTAWIYQLRHSGAFAP